MTAAAPFVNARVYPNSYRDSVELMGIAREIEQRPHIVRAGLLMATPANVDVIRLAGLYVEAVGEAGQSDLVVAIAGEDEEAVAEAMAHAEQLLSGSQRTAASGSDAEAAPPQTIGEALVEDPEAKLVMVSTPGDYATAEAWKALKAGMHVFLFSDNVSVADEVELKRVAVEKGLLLMGPDCGTAIIDGIPLGFANVVARGNVGIVAASGTGLQEVACLVDRAGAGVSQAIGVGGRDLSATVGGRMMRAALQLLAHDDATDVIVCIAKPPAPEVAAEVLDDVRSIDKPVVVCFLGGDPELVGDSGAIFTPTLEAAARGALESLGNDPASAEDPIAEDVATDLADTQTRIRGLFCGGTLATEAAIVLETEAAGESVKWDITDLGADEYTRGRPHPMIEPHLRAPHVEEAAQDPSVGVVLLDVVLGHGSHDDPAGVLVPAVDAARSRAASEGRSLVFVASVCGTEQDPQGFREQVRTLAEAGVLVADSNAQAARIAARVALHR